MPGTQRGSGTPCLASSHALLTEVVWRPSTADIMSDTLGHGTSYLLLGTESCHDMGKDRPGLVTQQGSPLLDACGQRREAAQVPEGPPHPPPTPDKGKKG